MRPKINTKSGISHPERPTEYYILLFCKRKKDMSTQTIFEARRSWRSLTSDEQEIFINKFNKWQASNSKRLGSLLQHAEPFMKKKKTTKEERNYEVETLISNVTKEKDSRENEGIKNFPLDINDSISNAYSESEPQDCNDNISNIFSEPQDINDDMSNAFSEPTNPVYAASVIDTDLDETTSHQEINAVQNESLTEPVPPTVRTPEDLFETLKSSGARPELAEVEWKHLGKREKHIYRLAMHKMNKQYLAQLEEYLENLPDPELFNYYIKTLNK